MGTLTIDKFIALNPYRQVVSHAIQGPIGVKQDLRRDIHSLPYLQAADQGLRVDPCHEKVRDQCLRHSLDTRRILHFYYN